MKLEDYGYSVKTMQHDRRLTKAESAFLGILWEDHLGKENKIPGRELAIEYAYCMEGKRLDAEGPDDTHDAEGSDDTKEIEQWGRDVRHMQTHFIEEHDNIPVYSKSGIRGGYWIAANEDEGDEYYYPMRQRGVRGIRKATRGKKASMVEAVTQLAFDFNFDEIEGDGGIRAIPQKAKNTAPEIVDALLDTMTQNPERFSGRLERLREKYFSGGVLLGKDRLAEMRAKTRELSEMVAGLE